MNNSIPTIIGAAVDSISLASTLPGIGALLVLFLGHRFTLGRERRKEWNEVADRLRIELEGQVGKVTPYTPHFSSKDIALLIAMTDGRKGACLRKRAAEYAEARQQGMRQDTAGQPYYERTDHIDAAVQALLDMLGQRR